MVLHVSLLSGLDDATTGLIYNTDDTIPLSDMMVTTTRVWALALVTAIVALLVMVYVPPVWMMNLIVRHSHPSVLWCASTSEYVCALTIDDAPSPSTPMILDVLKEYNVKATFFIISDQIKGHENILERIVGEGHRLGNHLTEDRASILYDLPVFKQKLRECDEAIQRFQIEQRSTAMLGASVAATCDVDSTVEIDDEDQDDDNSSTTRLLSCCPSTYGTSATPTKWLRPGSGWFTTRMRDIVVSHGYRICMGSVYPHDAQIKSAWINSQYLRLRTRPGSVIIVHNRPWTIDVLRWALPELTRKFRFVPLDEIAQHQRNG